MASICSPARMPTRSTAAAIGLAAGRIWAAIGSDTSPWRGASRRHAARLVEQELSRRRPAEPDARRSAQSLGAARTPLRDRSRDPSPDRRRRNRARRASMRATRPLAGSPTRTARAATNRSPPSGAAMPRRSPATSRSAATCSTASRTRPAFARPCSDRLGGGFSLAGSYAEGIAQPTFFDLYGFFPGNFVGNPDLKPESSRGFELSLRYRRGPFGASLTGYRQRLHDEIVNNATFTSVLNAPGKQPALGHRGDRRLEARAKSCGFRPITPISRPPSPTR